MANTKGLYWFTNDLRVHDNPALALASRMADGLLCVYLVDSEQLALGHYTHTRLGDHRKRFIEQSLLDLDQRLRALGQRLLVVRGRPETVMAELIEELHISDVFRSQNAGWYENRAWQLLQDEHKKLNFHTVASHTLFDQDQLPFGLKELPSSFTQFRKQIEALNHSLPIAKPTQLPPPANVDYPDLRAPQGVAKFVGGESAALNHLEDYFSADLPAHYKEVRNELDGWSNSCKLSPWLATGCLSARQVSARISEYEQNKVANDSTYWIYFELLWREFFQWYAHSHGTKLFAYKGLNATPPLTSFYSQRFQKWVHGTTPYPIVNAGMNELRETGYLSNRGRQIVASCLVNELSLDWRYGAAYFEHSLIDYDVANNWGNWQYLAGVGADTRGPRHFNLDKQTAQFDPDGAYLKRWHGEAYNSLLDSVDAADWPVS